MNVILFSAIWGLVMMFSGIFIQKKSAAKGVALIGALLLLGANIGDMQGFTLLTSDFNGMLLFDRFGHLLLTVLIVSLLFYFLLSADDIEKVGNHPYEYFTLIFFVFAGIGLVTYFNHLLILFLGIEIISIPLYILTGTDKRNLKSNEASLKYFLMGAFSTGIMLMGIALLYGAHGTFRLEGINMSDTQNILLLTSMGVVLMLIAMSFKVSAAPFHFWTPDVYDGAPTVFTGYMATIVKAAGFIAFLRLFENAFGSMP
ncbi:MAG: NADH-quinone oxidoreductase subunit N, partial [Bacteroidetes bacterium]|nr:NADH-quinone oxidoreductase subunit N [Bacteroidota bacterium]